MNEWLNLSDGGWWYVAGWTMLHFLWLGTLVGFAAGVCRLVLRRSSANLRYAAALTSFVALAALPLGIGEWLAVNRPASVAAVAERSVLPVDDSILAQTPALGSAGGFSVTESAAGVVPAAPIVANKSSDAIPPALNPRPGRGLTGVFADLAIYLPWAWLTGTPLTFLLLTTGVVGAERLRRSSRILDDGPIAEACAELAGSLRIGRDVTVAICERIAAPVLIGIVRPMILLPSAALTGWSPDEIEMVLLHELAHVRRWDNLVNLLQRFVEAALFFHPAVWLVSRWIRAEREACCDAVVVGRTNRPHAYAETLVALAAQLPRSVLFHPAATSAMATGPLRGRIRRILNIDDDPMLVSGKSLGVVMSGLLLAATLVVLNLPTNTRADEEKAATSASIDGVAKTDVATQSKMVIARGLTTESPTRVEITDHSPVSTNQKQGQREPSIFIAYTLSNDQVTKLTAWLDSTAIEKKHVKLIWGQSRSDWIIEATPTVQRAIQSVINPIEPTTAAHCFPTLEEQRQADLAWKRLGFEFAPLPEKFKKHQTKNLNDLVRESGYDGGVLVTAKGNPRMEQNDLQPNDILVGLHVWPITNMEDLANILSRVDLYEVNPMKFYALRVTKVSDDGRELEFSPIIGRIHVNLDSLMGRSMPRSADPYAPGWPKILTSQERYTQAPSQPTQPSPAIDSPPETRFLDPLPVSVAKIFREHGPIVVDLFYHDNSQRCRPMLDSLKDFQRANRYLPIEINRKYAEVELAAVAKYNVTSTPTMVVSKDGEVLLKFVGITSAAGISDMLAKVADKLAESADGAPALRYNGKTFEEWRTAWQTELSLEKRLEVVKALAAFGASGRGKEAAEAILDVANQLDWTYIQDSAKGRLQQACIDAFTSAQATDGYRIPSEAWFPLVVPIVEKSGDQFTFASYLAYQLSPGEKNLIPRLIELTKNSNTRNWAIQGLKAIDPPLEDPRVLKCFRDALSQNGQSAADVQTVIYYLSYVQNPSDPDRNTTLRFVPELESLLFDANEGTRRKARLAISWIQPADARELVKRLNARLDDESDKNRTEVIRALAAIGPQALTAESTLEKMAISSTDPNRYPAGVALERIRGNQDNASMNLGINASSTPFAPYQRQLEAERRELFPDGVYPPENRSFGGGGGVF